jgi:hypothetical protein
MLLSQCGWIAVNDKLLLTLQLQLRPVARKFPFIHFCRNQWAYVVETITPA